MYCGKITPPHFQEENTVFHGEEREALTRSIKEKVSREPVPEKAPAFNTETAVLLGILVFLLSDNSKKDMLLIGIIVYLLL